MLFDFQAYVMELRDNPEKRHIIEEYEKFYGNITGNIHSQNWYVDYVSKFSNFYKKFKFPEELSADFDWEILFNLTAASFSNDTSYLKPNKTIINLDTDLELEITVTTSESTITKKISELWGFQILRLYEIYIEEQINLQISIATSAKDAISITTERIERYNIFKNYSERLDYFDKRKKEEGEKENLLYHYTSVKTIDLIIKNRCIWATDVTKLNDRKEQKIWFEIFDKVIESFASKEDYDLHKEIIGEICIEIENYKNNYDSFISSFSEKEDLLSQWRAYGDNGEGICIAFDIREFLDMLYADNKNPNLYNGKLDYNYQAVFEDTYKLIYDIVNYFHNQKISLSEFKNKIDNTTFFNEKCEQIWLRIQDSKDSSFFEESEFRLFLHQLKDKPIKTVDTFERNKRLIPYVKLEFGDKPIPIRKIIIGPACKEYEDLKSGIERLLKNNGYVDVDKMIKVSTIPYRQ